MRCTFRASSSTAHNMRRTDQIIELKSNREDRNSLKNVLYSRNIINGRPKNGPYPRFTIKRSGTIIDLFSVQFFTEIAALMTRVGFLKQATLTVPPRY